MSRNGIFEKMGKDFDRLHESYRRFHQAFGKSGRSRYLQRQIEPLTCIFE